jgi:hypothetical protein
VLSQSDFQMDEEELFMAAAICIILKKKIKWTRWSKDWLLKRKQFSHVNLLKELSLEPTDWRSYLRMDEESYFSLLEMITPMIKKQDTVMRQSVTRG